MRLLLFSGGLDSTALAHLIRPDCLFFVDYGQVSAKGELIAATQIAADLQLPFDSRSVDCTGFGAGDMAGTAPISAAAPEFWPYRNQLLITLAAMAYARHEDLTIYVGSVATDVVHPDGRSAFFDSMGAVLAAQGSARVEFPARNLSSEELLHRAAVPNPILAWAFSCHRAPRACGQCRGCIKHFQTIAALRA